MGFLFDGTNDYVALADHAALTLPDGDWTVAGWVKLTSSAGASDRFPIRHDRITGDGYEIRITTDGVNADEVSFIVQSDNGTFMSEISTSSPFAANTDWTHLALKRSGDTVSLYVNNISVASATNASLNAVNPDENLYLGNRDNADANLNGSLAEWAKWDRALSTEERAALLKGYAPSFFPNSLAWYVPMVRDYVEVRSGITVTNNGSAVAAHPPIIYPSGPYIIQAPVSAGETFEFAGSETVSFDGSVSMVQTAALTGAEEVSFDGTADTVLNDWRMTGSETVSFDGTADTIRNHWLMAGAESVSFDGSAALKQSAALTGSETVSFDGAAALDVAAIAFAGQGVLSFDGSIATLNLILEMEAAQSVLFDGEAELGQQALFEGAATLSFDGVAALTGFQWDPVETPASMTWSDVD